MLSPPGSIDSLSPPCASPLQDQKILFSIYNISMSLWEAAAGSLRGPEELALWKVARNTEVVFRESCRSIRKVGALPLPSHPMAPSPPAHGLWAQPPLLGALLAAHGEYSGSSCSIPWSMLCLWVWDDDGTSQ